MTDELSAEAVARYLQNHPELLEDYPELLVQMRLPSPHGDKAISLGERQVQALREKSRQLEAKLAELIRFGEENHAIGEKLHRLMVDLLAPADFEGVVAALYDHLGGPFAIPHVALRLWDLPGRPERPEFAAVGEAIRARVTALSQPYCGGASGLDIAEWFGERGSHVRSLALVPLKPQGSVVGVLVLASEEAHRFYPEMGTLYLGRIGEMTAAALIRTLG